MNRFPDFRSRKTDEVNPRLSNLESLVRQLSTQVQTLRDTSTQTRKEHVTDVQRIRYDQQRLEVQLQDLDKVIKHSSERTRDIDKLRDEFELGRYRWEGLLEVLRRRTDNTEARVERMERITNSHEIRLSGAEAAISELGKSPAPNTPVFDVREGMQFSSTMKNWLQKAWDAVNNPRIVHPFKKWLSPQQQSIVPSELDVLGSVHLINSSAGYAHISELRGNVAHLTSNAIRDVTVRLVLRKLLEARQLDQGERASRGIRPVVYTLTDKALEFFLGSSPSAASTGDLHALMEIAVFNEALSAVPPELYLSVPQMPGQTRFDGVLVKRLDTKAFDWSHASAVNIETPTEILAHSSTEAGKEGQVWLNFVTPFSTGIGQLRVVCLKENVQKLTQLKEALPTWMRNRIEIGVVSV